VIVGRNFRRILRQLHHVIEHGAILCTDFRRLVIPLQRVHERFVQSDATQKLCVGFDSIDAPVRYGNHDCNHFVLAALQRQVWRHQRTESAEGMKQGIRD
jgi:hypothetical protein